MVAKVGVVEDLARLALREAAVLTHRRRDVVLAHETALVPEAAAHRLPARARVNELNLAPAVLLLAVRHQPNIGADTGVVKHLLRQGHDRFEPIIADNPLPDL